MIENTNTKQFYPGPILNNTLEITDFLFNDAEQIKIKHSKLDEEGVLRDIDLNYPTDYEVTKVLPSDINAAEAALTASTGQITLKNVNVLAGEKLTVYRVSQIIQDKDYPRTGAFPAATHEGALDYLTMQNQEQKDEIDRALKVPISTQNFEGSLPLPIPSRALKINNDGTGFEMSEFDPDLALNVTKEYAQNAQNAANAALASQSAAASSSQNATEQANMATTQAGIAKEQATIATTQAGIATAKASEVVESGNNAITAITEQETTSKNNIETKGAEQIELIQNEGATQVANVQSTGFYMRDDKLYYINSQGEETEFKSDSGLEVCDIGMALYVDETKGLRRYLNGQIVDINTNTQAFLDRLKQITALHPSLLCTEEKWQTAKTRSAFGQVGKFVFNYSGDKIVSVRLPRVVNVQGLFDLQNLGMTVSAGLPNIKSGNLGYVRSGNNIDGSGALQNNGKGWYSEGANVNQSWSGTMNFDASRSNPIYGNSNTVQPEAIQYPYFIQIATGSETKNNIINDIELNNPYSLFDSKYSDHELNNLSWLKSEGQWNAKAVYPTAYDKLLKVYNGTETVEGLSVKLSTEEYTDYDFVLNTADETFRLPLKTKLASGKAVVGNGISVGLMSNHGGVLNVSALDGNNSGLGTSAQAYGQATGYASSARSNLLGGIGITTDPTKSGLELSGSGLYLYYYVGETVQNANLIDAGRIGEQLATKTDMLQASGAGMPSNRHIDVTVGASNVQYTAPANGWFVINAGSSSSGYIGLANATSGVAVGSRGLWQQSSVPCKKGDKVVLGYDGNIANFEYFRFIYAQGSESEAQ